MKVICRKCKGELETHVDKTHNIVSECKKCGEEGYIASSKGLRMTNGDVTCSCLEPRFILRLHLNMKPRHIYKYMCRTCGNLIEVE